MRETTIGEIEEYFKNMSYVSCLNEKSTRSDYKACLQDCDVSLQKHVDRIKCTVDEMEKDLPKSEQDFVMKFPGHVMALVHHATNPFAAISLTTMGTAEGHHSHQINNVQKLMHALVDQASDIFYDFNKKEMDKVISKYGSGWYKFGSQEMYEIKQNEVANYMHHADTLFKKHRKSFNDLVDRIVRVNDALNKYYDALAKHVIEIGQRALDERPWLANIGPNIDYSFINHILKGESFIKAAFFEHPAVIAAYQAISDKVTTDEEFIDQLLVFPKNYQERYKFLLDGFGDIKVTSPLSSLTTTLQRVDQEIDISFDKPIKSESSVFIPSLWPGYGHERTMIERALMR